MISSEITLRSHPNFPKLIGVAYKLDVSDARPRSFSRIFSRTSSYTSTTSFDVNEYNGRASSSINYNKFYSKFGNFNIYQIKPPFSYRAINDNSMLPPLFFPNRFKRIRAGYLAVMRTDGKARCTLTPFRIAAGNRGIAKNRNLIRKQSRPAAFKRRWCLYNRYLATLKFSSWLQICSQKFFRVGDSSSLLPYKIYRKLFIKISKVYSCGFFGSRAKRHVFSIYLSRRLRMPLFSNLLFSSFKNLTIYFNFYILASKLYSVSDVPRLHGRFLLKKKGRRYTTWYAKSILFIFK